VRKGFADRTKAREAVLQALYWVESSGDAYEKAIQEVSERARLEGSGKVFAVRLGAEVLARREALDGMIAEVSERWDVGRIARVDRAVIRMALAEFLCFDDIPLRVSIDEAVELGKRFGGDESPGFINGILDAIARKHGIEKPGAGTGQEMGSHEP
jgi:transcription antitermination protein NusB